MSHRGPPRPSRTPPARRCPSTTRSSCGRWGSPASRTSTGRTGRPSSRWSSSRGTAPDDLIWVPASRSHRPTRKHSSMPDLHEKLHDVYDEVLQRNPGELEFHQAVHEVLDSL